MTVDPVALQEAADTHFDGYRIGASDVLELRVFQVPDLTFDEIHVDAQGDLQLPLIGSVRAAGRTPMQLSEDIEARLAVGFLRDPQVSISVSKAASQKVTLDGAVTKPGVYEMRGQTTLLQAVAMAEGPTRVADLRRVAVFRTVDGRSMIAIFDLRAIRAGQAEDPKLIGEDIVVVDTSFLSVRLQEALQALPALATFFYATTS